MRKRCIRRTMRRFLHGSERCTRIFDCFCLLWAKRVNPLLLASLFSDFSESKKSQKIFAAQTPPRKRGYVEDFAHQNPIRLRNLKNSRFTLSTRLCCEIARRCFALLDGLVSKNRLVYIISGLCHVTYL